MVQLSSIARELHEITASLRIIGRISLSLTANVVTLPYYRFYRQNTLLPVLALARRVGYKDNDQSISERLRHWQDRKLDEFKFVAAAGTLLAAAVIGCFSWPTPDTIFWLGPACWYTSLVLSLFSVLLSSSEAFLFTTIRDSPRKMGWRKEIAMILHVKSEDNVAYGLPVLREASIATDDTPTRRDTTLTSQAQVERDSLQVKVRWNMVFTWQAPIMLMAYSAICFLLGLSIFVLTPLYDGRIFDGESKAAVFYIVVSVLGGAVFVWCSYWSHRFVELDGEVVVE